MLAQLVDDVCDRVRIPVATKSLTNQLMSKETRGEGAHAVVDVRTTWCAAPRSIAMQIPDLIPFLMQLHCMQALCSCDTSWSVDGWLLVHLCGYIDRCTRDSIYTLGRVQYRAHAVHTHTRSGCLFGRSVYAVDE